MCCIAGFYLKDPDVVQNHDGLEKFVDALFLGIQPRGEQATGFMAVGTDGAVVIDKKPVKASDFIQDRKLMPNNIKAALLHTRFRTKGTVDKEYNNHPVIYGNCFVTHNGSIWNDDFLFRKHELERHAEVDTEIIAALMDKSNFDIEEMKKYLSDMSGPVACAMMDPVRHPNKLILVRTMGSPLIMIETPKMVLWASNHETLIDAWGLVIGTPPAKNKFEEVATRKFRVVTDEGVEEHNIPFYSTTSQHGTSGGNHGSRGNQGQRRESDSDFSEG